MCVVIICHACVRGLGRILHLGVQPSDGGRGFHEGSQRTRDHALALQRLVYKVAEESILGLTVFFNVRSKVEF